MALYEIAVQRSDQTSAKELVFDVVIFRDGDRVASFLERYSASLDDASIRQEIRRRAREFARVDSVAIDKALIDERAIAIADSVTGGTLEL